MSNSLPFCTVLFKLIQNAMRLKHLLSLLFTFHAATYHLHAQEGAVAWVTRLTGEATPGRNGQFPYDIDLLPDGVTVVVIGEYWGSIDFPNAQHFNSAGESDIFLAAFDITDGACIWAITAGGLYSDRGLSSEISMNGVITIRGTGFGRVSVGSDVLNCDDETTFTAQFNPDGSYVTSSIAIDAYELYQTPVRQSAWANGSGTVLAGRFSYALPLGIGEPNETILPATAGDEVYVASFSETTELQWASAATGQGDDWPTGLLTLPGNTGVLVIGCFEQDVTFAPLAPITSTGGPDAFIAYYANDLEPPAADFAATPTTGPAPLTVSFTDTSSGVPTRWEWDFNNDGNIDSVAHNPTYRYNEPGTYSVRLVVSNAADSDAALKVAYITVGRSSPGQ